MYILTLNFRRDPTVDLCVHNRTYALKKLKVYYNGTREGEVQGAFLPEGGARVPVLWQLKISPRAKQVKAMNVLFCYCHQYYLSKM